MSLHVAPPAHRPVNVRRAANASNTHARFWRTRATLSSAILTLAATHPSSVLSVSDIVRAAGINRSTFYTHAESPTALLTIAMRTALERQDAEAAQCTQGDRRAMLESALHPVLAHVNTYNEVYRTSLLDAVASGALFQGLSSHLGSRIEASDPTTSPEHAAVIAAAAAEAIKQLITEPSPVLESARVMSILDAALGWPS